MFSKVLDKRLGIGREKDKKKCSRGQERRSVGPLGLSLMATKQPRNLRTSVEVGAGWFRVQGLGLRVQGLGFRV